jgi:hypothetical protein
VVERKKNEPSKKISFAIKTIPGEKNKTITNNSTSTLEVTTNNNSNISLLDQITLKQKHTSVIIEPEQVVEISAQ